MVGHVHHVFQVAVGDLLAAKQGFEGDAVLLPPSGDGGARLHHFAGALAHLLVQPAVVVLESRVLVLPLLDRPLGGPRRQAHASPYGGAQRPADGKAQCRSGQCAAHRAGEGIASIRAQGAAGQGAGARLGQGHGLIPNAQPRRQASQLGQSAQARALRVRVPLADSLNVFFVDLLVFLEGLVGGGDLITQLLLVFLRLCIGVGAGLIPQIPEIFPGLLDLLVDLLELFLQLGFPLDQLSAPVIKCKKTPRKKCSFVAERREKR